MLDKLKGLGDLGKWKDVLEAAGVDIDDLPEILGDLKSCKKPNDVVAVLNDADIDFDAKALLAAIKDTGVLDGAKDGILGKLF